MKAFVIQGRDFEILRGLLDSRLATLRHIAGLYFEGKAEAAKKRLQKLKAAGLISEKRSRCYEAGILFLSEKGFQLLRKEGMLSAYPQEALSGFKRRMVLSEITTKHEIAVLDVKVAIHEAIQKEKRLKITTFSTWPLLHQFQLGRKSQPSYVLVKPDGFLRIQEEQPNGKFEYSFFLEVDRGSETLATLANKAIAYNRFYREGGMAMRHGKSESAFRQYPFRVLFVVKSVERQMNLAKTLLVTNPPILTQVCITTFDDLYSNARGNIWIQPMALKTHPSQGDEPPKRPMLE